MKTYQGLDIFGVMSLGTVAEAINGPYKGRRIERNEFVEAFFWEGDDVPLQKDELLKLTTWTILPTPIEFSQVRELIDSSFIVRLDTKDRGPRLIWKCDGHICTRAIGEEKMKYITHFYFDEIWDGKWSVYPKEVVEC